MLKEMLKKIVLINTKKSNFALWKIILILCSITTQVHFSYFHTSYLEKHVQ